MIGQNSEGAMEAIPPNVTLSRGKVVDLCMFIDSNHAGNKEIRISKTKFMMYMSMSLIYWYSMMQTTIETPVFGADFVSMKVVIDTLCAIWYKLRMMDILISGPTYIYGDEMSVIHNTIKPESTLVKSVMQLFIMMSASLQK